MRTPLKTRKMNQPAPQPGRPPKEGEKAIGQIQGRVTMARKNAYVKAAQREKLGLWPWMQKHLDQAAGYEPETTG